MYGQRILWTDYLKIITAIGILDYLLVMQMVKVRFGWRGDRCNVFEFLNNLFTELAVHACNMFTHLKLR